MGHIWACMRFVKIPFFFVVFCWHAFGTAHAQSVYDRNGNACATQQNDSICEITTSIFTLTQQTFVETHHGQLRNDLGTFSLAYEPNRINYYDKHGSYIGFYTPSEGRYYRVTPGKAVGDEPLALVYEGDIYTWDEKPRYRVDADFSREMLGFILFFFFN